MILADIFSLVLRIGELAFSATVAGLTGEYLHARRGAPASSHKRMIYTIVVAAISILFSLLFLLPFLASFAKWPVDLILFILWIVAAALLADFNNDNSCGSIWRWGNVTARNACGKYKANMAFAFLAAIFFLVSAILVSSCHVVVVRNVNANPNPGFLGHAQEPQRCSRRYRQAIPRWTPQMVRWPWLQPCLNSSLAPSH